MINLIKTVILRNILNYIYIMGVITIFISICTSTIIGVYGYEASKIADNTAIANLDNSMKNERSYLNLRMRYFEYNTKAPLYSLNHGIAEILPSIILLPDNYNTFAPQYIAEDIDKAVLTGIFGSIDLVTIIKYIITIISILFGYSLVCSEKESGTLKMLLTGRLSRTKILFGLYIGGLVPLIMFLMLALVISYIWAEFSLSGIILSNLGGVVYLTALSVGLIVTYFSISFAIGTVFTSTKASLAACVLVWVALNLIFPMVLVQIGKALAPSQSTASIMRDITKAKKQYTIEMYRRIVDRINEKLARGDIDTSAANRPYEAYTRIFDRQREVYNERISNYAEGLFKDYANSAQKTISVIELLSFLSPNTAYVIAANKVTGTGYYAYSSFKELITRHAKRVIEYLKKKQEENIRERGRSIRVKVPEPGDPAGRAELVYSNYDEELDLSGRPKLPAVAPERGLKANAAANGLLAFLAWTVVSLLVAWFRFLRLDAR